MNKSERFWDMVSSRFDRPDKNYDQARVKTIENVKKYLDHDDIVLDYGCATGTVAIKIGDHVRAVYGIDISSKMIAAAKRKASASKTENIDFALSTIFDERHKRESFDVILALNILHLLEDTQKVVQRLYELLRPGGFIVSSTVCLGETVMPLGIVLFPLTKIGLVPQTRFFKLSELRELITGGGFQIVETESLVHNPMIYFIAAKKT